MEIWREVKGFEGLYEVSNRGRIKSLPRLDSMNRKVRERIMATTYDWQGYEHVKLNKDGKSYTKYVHRLVAEAFIPNPMKKETVNHKDEIKAHNYVENLEWMTMKENANYGTRNIRAVAHKDYFEISRKISSSAHKKAVVQLKDGEVIKRWNSITSASKGLGVSLRAIQNVLRNEMPSCKGFQFEYAD